MVICTDCSKEHLGWIQKDGAEESVARAHIRGDSASSCLVFLKRLIV